MTFYAAQWANVIKWAKFSSQLSSEFLYGNLESQQETPVWSLYTKPSQRMNM